MIQIGRVLTKVEFLDYLKQLTTEAGSQRQLATDYSISAQYLSDVLHGHRAPGKKLLKVLGLEQIVYYRFIE